MSIPINEICFPQDTAERKRWFSSASFSHPAKMHLSLQFYLIEHYTKKGDTILDPMTGSGTILVACALERNVICVELEKKFVKMQKDNWEKISRLGPMLGYKMGEAVILQGDARNLDNVLADTCIFSPPYAESFQGDKKDTRHLQPLQTSKGTTRGRGFDSFGNKTLSRQDNPDNISNLPYGQISAVISSPPCANPRDKDGEAEREYEDKRLGKNDKQHGRTQFRGRYADAVITSPPYEDSIVGKEKAKCEKMERKSGNGKWGKYLRLGESQFHTYTDDADNKENIGNLKSENYLQAMLLVYQNCHRVLRPEGLMILVTKNFIREKKIVPLDLDTIKLCEQAGFTLIERLKRKLTQQSFWRRIYQQRYPDAPTIDFEDVLVFKKGLFE